MKTQEKVVNVAILISEILDVKAKIITRDIFVMMKRFYSQEKQNNPELIFCLQHGLKIYKVSGK